MVKGISLYLARHGNTFKPDEPPVFVGSQNDVPLVARGREQANQLAEYLNKNNINLHSIYCAPLKRTSEFAKIVSSHLYHSRPEPKTDNRLMEIDYGHWSGKTKEQIIAAYGEAEYLGWEERSVWPTKGGWALDEATIAQQIRSFAKEVLQKGHGENILVVSSNGVLRYFLKLIEHAFEESVVNKSFKMGTGHLSRIDLEAFHFFAGKVIFWDRKPELY